MKQSIILFGAALLAAACSSDKETTPSAGTDTDVPAPVELWPEEGVKSRVEYINNGTIQLGVDMDRGGAVFHFSETNTRKNLLNHVDEGRFVQQSYYGEPDGSVWNGQPWAWNPVQGGGSNGTNAQVRSSQIGATSLMITTQPVLWASSQPAEGCVMAENITLDGRVAHIRYTFANHGEAATDHPATHQEVPAVFADWDLKTLVFYDGTEPWTDGALRYVSEPEIPRLDLGGTNREFTRTEHWAAWVDERGWGLGVYTPGTELMTVYRFGSGPGGAQMGSCSYFAPIRTFAITKGMRFTYDVYLMIGTVDEMRAAFRALHAASQA